ncbi:hypothetical protein [Lacrimispora brassicae]
MYKKYMDMLHEYNVNLLDDEEIAVATTLSSFNTENDVFLGSHPDVIVTNKRLIMIHGVFVGITDISNIVSFTKEQKKVLFLKGAFYYLIILNKKLEVVSVVSESEFNGQNGKKLEPTKYRFYFKLNDKETAIKFEEIINNITR